MYWQYPKLTGPLFVVSHGNCGHSKHRLTPLRNAQEAILQNGFSFGRQPPSPLGQLPATLRGHFSHAIPQTPIRMGRFYSAAAPSFYTPLCSACGPGAMWGATSRRDVRNAITPNTSRRDVAPRLLELPSANCLLPIACCLLPNARMDRLMVSVSGVRGTVGGTLTPDVACRFGCAFATMLREDAAARAAGGGANGTCHVPSGRAEGDSSQTRLQTAQPWHPTLGEKALRVALARDTRPSGAMFAHAVTAGLQSCGASVVDLGVASTPGAALMTKLLSADGGVIITASHNPGQYNGIKFLQPIGTGLWARNAARLKEIWESGRFAFAPSGALGGEERELRANGYHVDAVCATADVTGVAARRFKVVLDSINGAGCVEAPMLLGRLGCEVAQINGEPTGLFAHAPEPLEENLGGLCAAVRKHRAHVGFALDPDADRLAVVDETGRFIGEEYTLALAAAHVFSRRKGTIATNLVTSRMVDDLAAAAGCRVVRAPTGEANVVQAMLGEGMRERCILGGEGNGGVIDPRVGLTRDSLVGMATILQLMARTGKSVSELVQGIPAYVMIKTKFACPAEAVREIVQKAREALAAGGKRGQSPAAAGYSPLSPRFNDADGLRADLPEGWVCVRASNTEPIMRIIAEAADRSQAEALIQQVRQAADAVLGKK